MEGTYQPKERPKLKMEPPTQKKLKTEANSGPKNPNPQKAQAQAMKVFIHLLE